MYSIIELVAVFAWGAVAACVTAAALRKRSAVTRVVVAGLAACFTSGALMDVRTLYGLTPVHTSNDQTWSQIRRAYAERSPALGDIITLTPTIENEFRTMLGPMYRARGMKSRAALDAAATAAIANILEKQVLPVAAHGSTAAVNSWGSIITPMMQQLAAISVEVCAEYAMTSFARYGDDKKAAALTETAFRSLIDAFKTSDSARYPLPDDNALHTQYANALRIAQPPFSDEEEEAFDALDKASPQRQCSLTLRLFEAVDRLDSSSRAMIFRRLMKRTD